MRIAVIGAGGVGGGFGAALAKAGADVTFIARGAHLAAMKSKGLSSRARAATSISSRPRPPTIPPTVGPVDFVLFCVKLWDVESAGAAIRPLVGRTPPSSRCRTASTPAERLVPDPRQGGA